jgi:hypothetical protein
MPHYLQTKTRNTCTQETVLVLPREVYSALHPLDQLAAQALEKVGKIRIIDEEER